MLNIKENVPLAQYTTFRIGGSGKYFAVVKSRDELKEAIDFAKSSDLPLFILGGGSNVLISDKGFNGLVVQVKFGEYEINQEKREIKTGAGIFLAKLVKDSVAAGWSGLEWAAGIPGTVGGAARGNAGAFGKSIADSVVSVEVLNTATNQFSVLDNEQCEFGYRDSFFKRNSEFVIISVVFKFSPGDKENGQKEMTEIIKKRIDIQPKGVGSAGSFFKNPVIDDQLLRQEFEKDTGKIPKDEKLPAGWLIDRAGLRGKRVGGAMVSEVHTNFIVNAGGATAEEVIILMGLIKQQIRDKFKTELETEVQFVGFNN